MLIMCLGRVTGQVSRMLVYEESIRLYKLVWGCVMYWHMGMSGYKSLLASTITMCLGFGE